MVREREHVVRVDQRDDEAERRAVGLRGPLLEELQRLREVRRVVVGAAAAEALARVSPPASGATHPSKPYAATSSGVTSGPPEGPLHRCHLPRQWTS